MITRKVGLKNAPSIACADVYNSGKTELIAAHECIRFGAPVSRLCMKSGIAVSIHRTASGAHAAARSYCWLALLFNIRKQSGLVTATAHTHTGARVC